MAGKSEVGVHCGLVPANALVLTGLATWPSVSYERPDHVKLAGATGLEPRDLLRDRQAF